jgi:hypothetical protein
MKDTTEVSRGTVEMLKPIAAANWAGLELIPFETIAERFLDLDEEGKQETLTVAFGKPFIVEGKGGPAARIPCSPSSSRWTRSTMNSP